MYNSNEKIKKNGKLPPGFELGTFSILRELAPSRPAILPYNEEYFKDINIL